MLQDKLDKYFKYAEDVVYVSIGVLLLLTAIHLIISSLLTFIHAIGEFDSIESVIHVMDRMLLALMVVEILYTVRVSIKSHILMAEPFFIVGLIAAIRRILVISVESAYNMEKFINFMIEVGVLSFVVIVFVLGILLLRKYRKN